MTPEALDEAMGVLKLNAQGLAVCVGVTDRTVRRWLEGTRKIPPPVAKLVTLMIELKINEAFRTLGLNP